MATSVPEDGHIRPLRVLETLAGLEQLVVAPWRSPTRLS